MKYSIIITSGKRYMDIDAYAGCIAYAILLNDLEYNAKAITTAVLNNSIPSLIKNLNLKLDNYIPQNKDKYIILDVSNPDALDNIVNQNNIIEVIDHHVGYEYYWHQLPNVKTQIEFIGSICTIIFELFEKHKKTNLLTKDLCQLLMAGILDNTLNLMANITNKRDTRAYKKLLKIGHVESDWNINYFKCCEKEILEDLEEALNNDIKPEFTNELLPKVFGQLVILEKDKVLERLDIIEKVFNAYDKEWMLNLISLDDNKSYIIAENEKTKQNLEKLFNRSFSQNILVLDKFMLRKEIIKKAKEFKSSTIK